MAAKAGMPCEVTGRHADRMGVDATVRALDNSPTIRFSRISYWKFSSRRSPGRRLSRTAGFPNSLKGIDRYNKLRNQAISRPRILVVLFLPEASEDWLNCTREEFAIRRSAWWVSL